MPDKPNWYTRLPGAIKQMERMDAVWVDRAAVELVLGVGRRRAQQILKPLVRQTVGRNGLARREEVVLHLRKLARGQVANLELGRRERLGEMLGNFECEQKRQPRVLVEAPVEIVNQQLDTLPAGVRLSPGRIVIEGFSSPDEAKQKFLALIMAIGNDPDGFDERISGGAEV